MGFHPEKMHNFRLNFPGHLLPLPIYNSILIEAECLWHRVIPFPGSPISSHQVNIFVKILTHTLSCEAYTHIGIFSCCPETVRNTQNVRQYLQYKTLYQQCFYEDVDIGNEVLSQSCKKSISEDPRIGGWDIAVRFIGTEMEGCSQISSVSSPFIELWKKLSLVFIRS